MEHSVLNSKFIDISSQKLAMRGVFASENWLRLQIVAGFIVTLIVYT